MQIPLVVTALQTLFVCAVIPVYSAHYGPSNFLWFSDIALLVSVAALWSESALLASMQAVAILALETVWIVDFLSRLLLGVHVVGLSRYMFDSKHPLAIRALSLFHVWLPPLLVWMVYDFGYDRRAWLAQTLACWLVLPLTWVVTKPADNVNWVYGLGDKPQTRLPAWLYLMLLMAGLPLCVYWPTHLVLQWLAPPAS